MMNYLTILAACGLVLSPVVAMAATPAEPPTVALPTCPAATRDLWFHQGGEQYSLGGRIWTLPQIQFVRPPQTDEPGGAIDMLFRIRQGAIFSSSAGWNPDNFSDHAITIHIRSLGTDSPPDNTTLYREFRETIVGPTDRIALWGLDVDASYDAVNIVTYHAINGNLPILLTCHGRFPHYNGPFFPSCEGFQAVYPHAAMEYWFSADYLADVPRIVSCLNTMIDDLSKRTSG